MPRLAPTQPLPQDLRNQSFQGISCEGWDFAGRDIRGCDFRNAKLNGADFSKAIAGRSQRQIMISLLSIVAFAFADVFAGVVVFTGAVSFAGVVVFAGAVVVAGTGAFAIVVAFAVAVSFVSAGLSAIEAFSKGQILLGIGLSVLAIVLLVLTFFSARQAIREFKTITGTNFEGADLGGVNFSHATLNNCNFNDADTSHINWSHIEGARSTIDFTYTRMQLLISRKGTNRRCATFNWSPSDQTEAVRDHSDD